MSPRGARDRSSRRSLGRGVSANVYTRGENKRAGLDWTICTGTLPCQAVKHQTTPEPKPRRPSNAQHKTPVPPQLKQTRKTLTNTIHRMRRQLKHAVEHEVAELREERVPPVPRVVADHAVRLRLDPEIEQDEQNAGHPSSA